MRNKILIYSDEGTADISNLYKCLKEYFKHHEIIIETTSADAIIKENSLDETVFAFFMPGGRATPYMHKLKVLGNAKIAGFVKKGGVYVGICAGAYYASRKVFFETDVKELSIIQECGLNLINADAIGTLYKELQLRPYSKDFSSATAVRVRWLEDNEQHISYYHGGPYFQIYNNDEVKILAEYELNRTRLPAVVMQRHGLGTAIVSGLHIEDRAMDLRRILSNLPQSQTSELFIEQLECKEASRYALFNKIMQKIQTTRT